VGVVVRDVSGDQQPQVGHPEGGGAGGVGETGLDRPQFVAAQIDGGAVQRFRGGQRLRDLAGEPSC